MEVKSVAIIGGGVSGILSIKSCKEEPQIENIVCFEKTSYFGGLWKFRENDLGHSKSGPNERITTVAHSTIANSSKEVSAFSDFPPKPETPNYMHNKRMLEYIKDYADHFNCLDHIKYNHEVIRIEKNGPKWLVEVKDWNSDQPNNVKVDEFDAVMVCTGHHSFPRMPKIPGLSDFEGQKVHSQDFKRPSRDLEDKNALVIGVGNSGLDMAVELSSICNRVYLSTRRGAWILPRLGFRGGKPNDLTMLRRYMHFLKETIPVQIQQVVIESMYRKRFDHQLFGLRPDHPLFHEHPAVNDIIPSKIVSGQVVVKGDVDRFTQSGVIFDDESEEHQIDVVLFATGYRISFPFFDNDFENTILDQNKNSLKLYKHVFHTDPKFDRLGFIGFPNALGPLFPIAEIQSRWFVQTILGHCALPGQEQRLLSLKEDERNRKRLFTDTFRHGTQVEWQPYLDDIASQFGAKPDLTKLMKSDPKLWMKVIFGPILPYHYRLQGPHSWDKARETILNVDTRVECPFQTRTRRLLKDDQVSNLPKYTEFNILLRLFFGLFVVMLFEAVYMFTP